MMYDVGGQPTAGVCQVRVTFDPFDDVASPVGTAGGMLQPPTPLTTTRISFDGALVPLALFASTRTKYEPAPTPVAVSVGELDPVLALARLARPEDEPAWST